MILYMKEVRALQCGYNLDKFKIERLGKIQIICQ